ncbi:MAG: aminotransferase class V-fold PLP-dependent enzyme [Meiothermus ruber]|uniref:aminotransferase class V-fold PLP-dependent enzyme n=1 Tax=Meiothermus ruber TaxID=277 RepID=UPI0023F66A0C|nr:aminotransferase class V-fold PLP-dependent enzyme [Meiothermus ruber]MCL6530777.1 aminotransferase class V-fold PLP-dependent enzyme [Meiothermus ruber]
MDFDQDTEALEPSANQTRFGRAMRAHWFLDPSIIYLNHGTVGATPKQVLAVQQALREEMEQQPARFLLRELSALSGPSERALPRLREAAQAVARFMGAEGQDLVFVDNATTGVNAVLGSLELQPGDEILITNLAYGAVRNAAAFAAERRGGRLVTLELPFPVSSPADYVNRLAQALTPRTRLAILDHITSETALVLPLAAMAACCRAAGVPVLVDGAHAPGAIPLDIPRLGVDYYTGNLHKWALAPKGCGFLWVAPERQQSLHPPVISWGLGRGFVQEFDWVGTQDPSAYLAAPEGIRFMRDLGVEAMRQYNHDLAWGAARMLMERWNLELPTPQSMIGSMVTLPLPQGLGSSPADAARLKDALLFEDHIEVPVMAIGGRLWARISAQIYNDLSDIERFAQALERRL